MEKLKLSIVTGIVLSMAFFTSCTDSVEDIKVDQELLVANAQIDFANELDFNAGAEAANDNSGYSNRSSNTNSNPPACATISVDTPPGVFPKVITVDYGNGCINNGITRSGILTITLSGYFMDNGSTMTIERSNYYINGRKIEGTVVYENQTTNTQLPKWTRTVSNGKLTTVAGVVYNFNGTRQVQQIAGVGTLTLADNVYEVLSGNHTITKPDGTTLTLTILEKLNKAYACSYISSGKLSIQGSFLNGTLDYGNGTCDNQAVYTHSNGNTYNINL